MIIQIPNQEIYLRSHEIKPSLTRLKIFDFLVNTIEHPTVDGIYKNLASQIPTLSKTTVYNTLKLFMEKGIVKVVNIEDNETRYDADVSFHGHFKCTNCGKVYDFPINEENTKFDQLKNFSIEESHFYLKGKCSCTAKN